MSINITTEFDYAGGKINVELFESRACVDFTKDGETVIIEESDGQVVDWFRLYQNEWILLSGAALDSAEQKFAKQYGISSIGSWIIATQDSINNGEFGE